MNALSGMVIENKPPKSWMTEITSETVTFISPTLLFIKTDN